jgi:hypothetical protein
VVNAAAAAASPGSLASGCGCCVMWPGSCVLERKRLRGGASPRLAHVAPVDLTPVDLTPVVLEM